MLSEKEQIIAVYKKLHDGLSESYYSGKSNMDKTTFDHLHGAIWADLETELISKGFLDPLRPSRDLAKEIDALIYRIKALETSETLE